MTLILWLATLGLILSAPLTFEHTLVEVRADPDTKSVVADFNFENKSDQPVTIAKYEKTCTCVSVQVSDSKLIYAPGEKGVIRTTFELGGFTGTVDKPVNLWFDQDPAEKPSLALTTRVHIPVLVVIDKKSLKWEIDAEPITRKFDIRMEHHKPIQILTTKCTSDNFKMELTTLEEGKHYELQVKPTSTTSPCLGAIRIETDCEIPRHRTQNVFVVVQNKSPAPTAQIPESTAVKTASDSIWLTIVTGAAMVMALLGLRLWLRRKNRLL